MMKKSGFSLLELSVVLTILAIVVAGGLTLGTAKVQQAAITNTYQEMQDIEKALKVFLAENDRLPCPASITLVRTDPLFGREATDCADASPPTGLTRVEYPAASGQFVRIGGVPFYSLEMPDRYLEDASQNRYLYAVQESAITSLTSTSTGNISVVDDAGTAVTDAAVIVLVSAGASHKGAYTAKTGALFSACDATNKDRENCDADGVFTDALFNDGDTAANFFDDIIIWKTRMGLFETVSTEGGGGGNPWEWGWAAGEADYYPLEVKGVTALAYDGDFGVAFANSQCDTEYPGSWFGRSNDLLYIEDVDIPVATYVWFHDDDAYGAANHAALQHKNCTEWTTNTATYTVMSGTYQTRGAALYRFANTDGTIPRNSSGTAAIAANVYTCDLTARILCVGEK